MKTTVTGIANVAVGHQDLKEPAAIDRHIQWLLSGLQRALGKYLLGTHHPYTRTQLQT